MLILSMSSAHLLCYYRYDGSFEPKTEAEYKRDIFLYKQEVKPAADRLKTITLVCAALWVASCVGLKASYALKPRFNEYDPRVLERVRSDADFAAAAARASGGRPTYCDNRYYRAVANGGQGNFLLPARKNFLESTTHSVFRLSQRSICLFASCFRL